MSWERPIRHLTTDFLKNIWDYLRVEVNGVENIPRHGPAIVYANHSGWSGFDAVMLAFAIYLYRRRIPRMIAHRFYFSRPWLAWISSKFGLVRAQANAGVELLQKNHVVIIFPEGEQGNFKPSSEMYQLQPFHTGLVRMALATGAPVIPCAIIGAEETTLNLGTVNIKNVFPKAITLPIPLLFIPLPVRWKISFYPMIDSTKYRRDDVHDLFRVEKIARLWRKKLQLYIYRELRDRPGIFIDRKKLIDRLKAIKNQARKARESHLRSRK